MKLLTVICLFFQVLSISAFSQAFKYHTVAPEENVYRIAQKYDITTEDIYKYNPDAKNGVQVGTKLVIPIYDGSIPQKDNSASNSAVTFLSHKVEKKETLYSLSKQYDVTVEDIKRYNKQLYAKELQNGETIQIPVFSTRTVEVTRPQASVPAKVPISKTREHIILPKETKYGIARKYGMTVSELEAMNPTVDVLQPGIMLKVGTDVLNEPVIIMDENYQFYEVQPQETLFSLTRRFQIDQDSLVALNPALKDGLKYGMVLKVPTKDAKGRDLEDIEVAEVEPFEAERLGLENNLKDFSTKNIVLMLPYKLNQISNDTLADTKKVLMDDRVMRISLDFHTGVIMAIERAKELGISTNLKVFDTQQQPSRVTSIIQANNFENVDAVIGPLLQATSEEAAARLSREKVPVISPITNRNLKSVPNLYQARPSDEMLRDAMIEYLRVNAQGKNVIIVADGPSSGTKTRLLNALPNAKTVNPGANNITESTLAAALVKGRENWVILESESMALLSSATSALNRLARSNNITLFTTNKNNSFESDVVQNDHLGRLHFHFPSEYREFDETVNDAFINAYKEKYGVIPNRYTVRGYDLTLDVLLRLGAMGTLEKSVEANALTEYVENKFLYRPNPNGGFYNDAVYIMHFNDDLTLSVAK